MRYKYDPIENSFNLVDSSPLEINFKENDTVIITISEYDYIFRVDKVHEESDACESCSIRTNNRLKGIRMPICQDSGLCPGILTHTNLKFIRSVPSYSYTQGNFNKFTAGLIYRKFRDIFCDELCPYKNEDALTGICNEYEFNDSNEFCILGQLMNV